MTAPSTWRSAGPARWLNKCDGTLDWSAVCARKLRLDPYLVWADLTSEPVDASQTEVTIGLLMQFAIMDGLA